MYQKKLEEMLALAREKHPVFAEGRYHALGVIRGEYGELEYAVEHESQRRQRAEALDVAITAIRFYLGEHLAPEKREAWLAEEE